MKKPVLSAIAVVVALAVIAGVSLSSKHHEAASTAQAGAPAVATRIYTVANHTFSPKLILDGEVVSLYAPDVASELAGKVLRTYVEPGQAVKKGALLVRLDAADAQLSATASRAEAARLAATAADKDASARRLTELVAQDLVSKASYETAVQDAAAAREAVKGAEAQASLAQRSASKAEVRAPFDATVSSRTAVPGAYVKAGDVLLTLVQPGKSHIRVVVPEAYSSQVAEGTTAELKFGTGESQTSTVTAVSPAANATTRSVEARLALPVNVSARPGSSAQVTLSLGDSVALAVPETAVLTEGTNAYVYTVDKSIAHRTSVEVGTRANGLVEVKKGLEAGATVAQEAAFVYEGAKVTGGTR